MRKPLLLCVCFLFHKYCVYVLFTLTNKNLCVKGYALAGCVIKLLPLHHLAGIGQMIYCVMIDQQLQPRNLNLRCWKLNKSLNICEQSFVL